MYQKKTVNKGLEKRREPRYLAFAELIIFSSGEFVRRTIFNYSNSGVMLTEALPPSFQDKVLEIVIANNDSQFEMFYGHTVDDSLQRISLKQNSKGERPQLEIYLN